MIEDREEVLGNVTFEDNAYPDVLVWLMPLLITDVAVAKAFALRYASTRANLFDVTGFGVFWCLLARLVILTCSALDVTHSCQ